MILKCDGCHYTLLLSEVQESMRGTQRAGAGADRCGLSSPRQVCQDKPQAIFTANLPKTAFKVFSLQSAPL